MCTNLVDGIWILRHVKDDSRGTALHRSLCLQTQTTVIIQLIQRSITLSTQLQSSFDISHEGHWREVSPHADHRTSYLERKETENYQRREQGTDHFNSISLMVKREWEPSLRRHYTFSTIPSVQLRVMQDAAHTQGS